MRRRVGEIWIGDRDRIWFFVIVTSLAALGVSLIMILTRWGPGLFDLDSFNYLASAQSLAAGEGFMVPANPARLRPMLYFAPFFSVVLALFERLGVNAIVGARWFNALLFGTNLFIFTSIILMASGSRGLALAASFLFLFSPDLIRAHAWVLSEPLLITLMLLALFSFLKWQRDSRLNWFLLLILSVSLAVMTKFVALSLVPGFFVLLLVTKLPRWEKVTFSVGVILAALLPFSLWTIRSYLVSHSFHGFSFSYVPLTKGNLVSAFLTLYTWFIPRGWIVGREAVVLAVSAATAIGFLSFLAVKARRVGFSQLSAPVFALVMFAFYIVAVASAKTMFDHGIGFQDRMLIPLYPLLLGFMVWSAGELLDLRLPWAKGAAYLAIAYLSAISLFGSAVSLPAVYADGLGWSSRYIVTSPAIAQLRGLASSHADMLFTNEPYGMFFHSGNVGYRLGGFPPVKPPAKVFLVLFKVHRTDPHPLLERFALALELVIEDEVLSIHEFVFVRSQKASSRIGNLIASDSLGQLPYGSKRF